MSVPTGRALARAVHRPRVRPLTRPVRRTRARLVSLGLGAAVALTVVGAGAAQAHVRVDPGQATAGSYAVLTFRVPTESATASTVKLEVDLPADHPFGSVSTQPVPGWTAQVVTGALPAPVRTKEGATITTAPLKIVWTADAGHGVGPGQFQQFAVSAGPVPDATSLTLPTVQTYSDGTVVRWDQPTPASGEEPEHPAPTLVVTPASGDAADGSAAVTASGSTHDGSDGDGLAVGLGAAGLVLGAGGLAAGLVALRRTRGQARAAVPSSPPSSSAVPVAGPASSAPEQR